MSLILPSRSNIKAFSRVTVQAGVGKQMMLSRTGGIKSDALRDSMMAEPHFTVLTG